MVFRTDVAALVQDSRPNLVLLCLPGNSIEGSSSVFEVVRQEPREISIVGIFQAAEPRELHRFFVMGGADFCLTPLRLEDLLPRVKRWSSTCSKLNPLDQEMAKRLALHQLMGESRAFVDAVKQIPRLARCDASVLITGETGTGKEMCARAIHHLGPRADHPFVPVNCGAIPPELVENELFGHDAGAFTGASRPTRGLVYEADGGTLFLDEIDSLPLTAQVKFLRLLQDQEYRPLGARKASRADLRIVAASNAELVSAVRSGRFRADLFYRLNILPLRLPPLRERQEDIPLLARHFITKCSSESASSAKQLSPGALGKLLMYEWPGNVRELANVIERAVIFSERPIITAEEIWLLGSPSVPEEKSFKVLKAHAIAQFEIAYIQRLLAANAGNISKAARAAKKNRRAFWQLMRKHAITVPDTTVRGELGQLVVGGRTNLS